MFNHKNHQKQTRSMDGFLSSSPRRPRYQPKFSNNKQNVNMQSRRSRLDDFSKSEGFHPQTTPKLSSSGMSLPVVNEQASLKRRFDFIRRKDKKLNKPQSKRKLFIKFAAVFAVLILATAGFVLGKAWWNAHKVLQGGGGAIALNKNVEPYQLKGEGDGRVNILLMGKGGEGWAGGDLTDSIMIASIDPINTTATMLSIPRDLWVKPDGLWSMKINAVYTSAKNQALYDNSDDGAAETAGINAIQKVVQDYLGVPIHYYAMIDFTAFRDAVNTVGGIDVTLDEAYADPSYGDGFVKYGALSLPAGTSHLDGAMALAYARSRYGDERGDFGRGEHQQKVITGIKDKVLSLGTFSNPAKVTSLLDTLGNRVKTSFSLNDLMRIYDITKQIDNSKITNVDLAMPGSAVVTTGNINGQSVVYPKAGVDNYDAVRAFVRNNLKDGYIIKENPSIIVLNGTTTPGAAQKRADELAGYGYNVIQVGDAPVKNITSNVLVDKTDGSKKYTKRYLEQRLGNITAVTDVDGVDLSTYQSDFVIIVGQGG